MLCQEKSLALKSLLFCSDSSIVEQPCSSKKPPFYDLEAFTASLDFVSVIMLHISKCQMNTHCEVCVSGTLVKIRSLYQALPNSERNIADYILANAELAPHRSVHEFASSGGVSAASVSRFVRRLGFAGFKEFKLDLARETAHGVESLFRAVTPGDSDEELTRKVFQGNMKSLSDTLAILDFSKLSAAAKAICRCGRLVLFGIGASAYVAHDAALRFSYLDIQAEAYEGTMHVIVQAMRIRPRDVVIGISHSGRSSSTLEGVSIARKKGAVTIGISNYPRSALNDLSTFFFCTSFPENRVKVAALSSRLAQLCVLDALYLLAARHKKRPLDVEEVNALSEKILRLKPRK